MPRFVNILGIIALLLQGLFFVFVPQALADDACAPAETGPLLYQVDRTPTQAKVYFTPHNDQIVSYTIVYGLKAEDQRYSVTFDSGVSTGAITYTLNDLEPGVQYFYAVRANTTCTNSPFGEWVADKPVKEGSSKAVSGIPVTGPETVALWGAISLMTMLGGLGIFTAARRKS